MNIAHCQSVFIPPYSQFTILALVLPSPARYNGTNPPDMSSVGLCARITVLALVPFLTAQSIPPTNSENKAVNTATEIRLLDPGWWPTKGTSSRDEYAGAASCTRCHAEIAAKQRNTPMAHALEPASPEAFQEILQPLHFHIGNYEYELTPTKTGASFSATNGTDKASVPLNWVFGHGQFGKTYLFQQNGTFFESRISYYSTPKALDFTTGSPRFAPNRIETALGRRMSPEEPAFCFGCHSTAATTKGQFDPDQMTPGITCEGCHGPGARHVVQMNLTSDAQTPTVIFNPAQLGPTDSVDFCGACHRTSVDVSLSGVTGIATLRFPAYRLEHSRCWGQGDARLTCIVCHDPHQPVARDPAAYDKQCLSCHTKNESAKSATVRSAQSCPVAPNRCVSCHMPKYTIPEMHTSFTDHKIAIHRNGDQFSE